MWTTYRPAFYAKAGVSNRRYASQNWHEASLKIYELQSNNLILNFSKAITQYSIHCYDYTVNVFIVYSQYYKIMLSV